MYGELMKKAELVAVQLLNQGCQPRDVIALFAPNSVDWIVVSLAAMRIGAVVAGISCLLTSGEHGYYTDIYTRQGILLSRKFFGRLVCWLVCSFVMCTFVIIPR